MNLISANKKVTSVFILAISAFRLLNLIEGFFFLVRNLIEGFVSSFFKKYRNDNFHIREQRFRAKQVFKRLTGIHGKELPGKVKGISP